MRKLLKFVVAGFAFSMLVALSGLVIAQDEAVLKRGETVWSDAGCGACHGERGEGGTSKDQPNGPAFHNTALTHEQLVEVVTCGRPGTAMASWVVGAYTAVACNGTTGPAPSDVMMIGYLTPDDVEALITYIEARFK